jgi:outer membrane protein assembly factor BamA
MNVGSFLWWENLDDSNAAVRETSNRYGAGFNIGYSLTDHASLSLGYQYVLKVADPSALGYYQNLVTLGFHYQF